MPALIYTPEVSIHIARADGEIIDVTDDIVRGSVTRSLGPAPSRMDVTLLNAGRKYDGMFTPMDRVVVYMKRIRRMLVYSGYLDSVPVFAAFAGSIRLTSSCTLKRLQNFMWDPHTAAATALFQGTTNVHNLTDGGLAKRTVDLLFKVSGWPKANIHIAGVPHDWFEAVTKVADKLVKEAEKQQMISIVGSDAYLNGTNPVGTGTDTVPGIGPGTGSLPGQIGRISWFGGPGGGAYGHMALTGESGTSPRDPWYCAMRFPYQRYVGGNILPIPGVNVARAMDWWKNRRILVVNPKTSKGVCVRAADWGPGGVSSADNRLIDVSKQALAALGASTDSIVHVAFAPEGMALGPQVVSASAQEGSALQSRGVTDSSGNTTAFTARNPRTPGEAIAVSQQMAARNSFVPVGTCMHQVAAYYGYLSSGWADPHDMIRRAPPQYLHKGDRHPPPGAVLLYDSGYNGHITLYLGNGMTATTDFPNSGQIGVVPCSALEGKPYLGQSWNLHYWGWAEPFFPNGARNSGINGGRNAAGTIPGGADSGMDVAGTPNAGTATGETAPLGMSDVGEALFNVAQWIGNTDFGGELLSGIRALMNDEPLLNTVDQYMSTGLRHYCSAPNGDFIAWFPDYFGHYETAAKMVIQDIEITQDFAVGWSDSALKTHMYVTSSSTGIEGLGDASAIYQQMTTAGIASVEFPELMQALFKVDKNLFADGGKAFLNRYGARPAFEAMDSITGGRQEFFFACHKFMLNWAQQFSANVPLTFMPEVFPGMLLVFPRYGVQGYAAEVTHTFDNVSGYTTSPTVIAWSTVGKNGIKGLPRGAAL